MLIKGIFGEKNYKNRFSAGSSALQHPFASGGWPLCPQTPVLLLSPTITSFWSTFLTLNAFHYPEKLQ